MKGVECLTSELKNTRLSSVACDGGHWPRREEIQEDKLAHRDWHEVQQRRCKESGEAPGRGAEQQNEAGLLIGNGDAWLLHKLAECYLQGTPTHLYLEMLTNSQDRTT